MQVITAAIEEEAVLIYEPTGKVLVLRDGLTITDAVARRLAKALDAV